MRFYSFVFTGEEHDEETSYGYCDDYQPHAVKRMFDHNNGMPYDLRWDEAGNFGQVSIAKPGEMFEAGLFLFWTFDSRMHAAIDEKFYSYYTYDHSGGSCASREQSQACLSYAEMEQRRRSQRRLKLVGVNSSVDVNAEYMTAVSTLNEPTLYPSAYMVLTNKGYTKHYYAGTERVAARLGGGGLDALYHVIENDGELQTMADSLFDQCLEQVNCRVLNENDLECIMRNRFAKEEFGYWIDDIPYQMKADVKFDHDQFKDMVNSMLTDYHNGEEKEVYFYHSDHLGSASWITDNGGLAVQHLQYLPFGERYISQRAAGSTYSERFTSTGKERDEETGYSYFGARYYDSDLSGLFLSVDPMADKYSSISPYAYCAWNPVKLVDPDGNDWYEYTDEKTKEKKIEWTNCHNQDELNKRHNNAKYLGVTADDGKTYYGLMGDMVNKAEDGERYRLVKDLDRTIINRALVSSAYASTPVDFSDVFPFESGAGSNNSRAGYSYAGGVAGISMNNKRDSDGNRIGMKGRFNDMRKMTGRSLSGPFSLVHLDAPRFSINGVYLERGREIAAISFANNPSMADRFERIYDGLKGRPLMHAQKSNNSWKQKRYR